LFFAVSVFLQGIIFTEPTPGLSWRAPVAALVMTAFFTGWCFLVTRTEGRPGDNAYDTTFRYSPRADLLREPAPRLWAHYDGKDGGKTVVYVRKKDDDLKDRYQVERKSPAEPRRRWSPAGVDWVEIENQGRMRFEKTPTSEGDYRSFVSSDGWIMQEFEDGPTGIPQRYRWGAFFANSFLNLFHGALWFLCLWLILRYQWDHALGFAVILWIVMTLIVLPMMLDQAEAVARQRARPTETAWKGSLAAPHV
jgi:hypothetical protein